MVASLKHNVLIIVLFCCVNILVLYEGYIFCLLYVPLCVIIFIKKYQLSVIIPVILIAGIHLLFVFAKLTIMFEHPLSPQFTATLLSDYRINGTYTRGFMKTENNQIVYYSYELKSEEEKNKWQHSSLAGAVVFVNGSWNDEHNSAHQYAFDMENYLTSKGAIGTFEIEDIEFIGMKKTLATILANQRFNVAKHIDTHFPEALAQEAKALLIGLQDGLDSDLQRAYQKLGITHLFAISGLHVALLSFLVYELMLRLHVRIEAATILLLIILPLYAFIAGGAPSIWRSVLVVEIIGILKLTKQVITVDDALSLSCLLFLFFSPHSLFQVGFQLSYLATYSLIYSSRILSQSNQLFIQNFYMTVVCQLLTYPLLLFHFYELSISSFLANIIFVPLFSFIILPLNIILLIFSYFSEIISGVLFFVYEPLRQLLSNFILFLKDIPYQMWVAGKPSFLAIICLYITVLIGLYLINQKKWKKAFMVLVIPALLFQYRYLFDKDIKISFIDVGQGDSILIELPRRKETILIDSGGYLRFPVEQWKERETVFEIGRQIVVPYLKGKGISTIDKFIITHADADHLEGAEEILKEINVKELHITPNSWSDNAYAELKEQLEKRPVRVLEKIGGNSWNVDSVHFKYMSPNDLYYEGNNDSLVLFMQYNGFKALFTGDLEQNGELAIIDRYPHLLADLSLLKAGHHGSKTSSAEKFIEVTKPFITIFTAGKNNRYGHPAKEVIERLKQRNLYYLITGNDGTIEIIINKEGQIKLVKSWRVQNKKGS